MVNEVYHGSWEASNTQLTGSAHSWGWSPLTFLRPAVRKAQRGTERDKGMSLDHLHHFFLNHNWSNVQFILLLIIIMIKPVVMAEGVWRKPSWVLWLPGKLLLQPGLRTYKKHITMLLTSYWVHKHILCFEFLNKYKRPRRFAVLNSECPRSLLGWTLHLTHWTRHLCLEKKNQRQRIKACYSLWHVKLNQINNYLPTAICCDT